MAGAGWLLSDAIEPPDDALAELCNTLGIDGRAEDRHLVVIAKVEDEVSRLARVN